MGKILDFGKKLSSRKKTFSQFCPLSVVLKELLDQIILLKFFLIKIE